MNSNSPFPKSSPPAPELTLLDVQELAPDLQLMLCGFQGLVNRGQPRLYLAFDGNEHLWPRRLLERGVIEGVEETGDWKRVLEQFAPVVKGLVVTRPGVSGHRKHRHHARRHRGSADRLARLGRRAVGQVARGRGPARQMVEQGRSLPLGPGNAPGRPAPRHPRDPLPRQRPRPRLHRPVQDLHLLDQRRRRRPAAGIRPGGGDAVRGRAVRRNSGKLPGDGLPLRRRGDRTRRGGRRRPGDALREVHRLRLPESLGAFGSAGSAVRAAPAAAGGAGRRQGVRLLHHLRRRQPQLLGLGASAVMERGLPRAGRAGLERHARLLRADPRHAGALLRHRQRKRLLHRLRRRRGVCQPPPLRQPDRGPPGGAPRLRRTDRRIPAEAGYRHSQPLPHGGTRSTIRTSPTSGLSPKGTPQRRRSWGGTCVRFRS